MPGKRHVIPPSSSRKPGPRAGMTMVRREARAETVWCLRAVPYRTETSRQWVLPEAERCNGEVHLHRHGNKCTICEGKRPKRGNEVNK